MIIWILFILPWIITIYRFIIREKVFSPMTKRKWIAILCSIVGGFVYLNYIESSGQWQPRLYQEEVSNLTKQEGFLKHTKRVKNNTYYIEMENGKKRPLEFVQLYTSRFKEYEEEFVIIWKKGRYIYQMEVEGNIVFLIDEANNEIFLFNCQGVLKNLMWIWGIVTSMFILMLYSESAFKRKKR